MRDDPVQAMAEAIWAGVDKGIRGRITRYDAAVLAEIAVAARPAIEREAKAAAWDEGYQAGWTDGAFDPTPNPYREEEQS